MSLGYTWHRQVTRAASLPLRRGPDCVASGGMCAWHVPVCVYVPELSRIFLPREAYGQGWVAS